MVWSKERIEHEKWNEVQERNAKKRIEDGIRYIEDITKMKIPKGVCVCETDSGGFAIVPTRDTDKEEIMRLNRRIELNAPISSANLTQDEIRAKCSGNYIKR